MKIYLDSIGCRLNQSEIEHLASQFVKAGHELVAAVDLADLVVVNTCAVTGKAVADSRQAIRRAGKNFAVQIVATGCWTTLEPEAVASLPGVNRVVLNTEKDYLVEKTLGILLPAHLQRQAIPGHRFRTRAFLKVQDGCDNHCTFCVTRLARGVPKSQDTETVLAEIDLAVSQGIKEVVLTGVHLGSWGKDFDSPSHLRVLLESILKKTTIERLHLSSLEPWDLDDEFFALWTDSRLCKHLHLPLQSGSPTVLRRMARKVTPESYLDLVRLARKYAPDLAITTDVIVGFPGETEQEFQETCRLAQTVQFAGGHVFAFSPRPGTAAGKLTDCVPTALIKQRSRVLRLIFEELGNRYRAQSIGKTQPVLWESARQIESGGYTLSGLSDHAIRVEADAEMNLWNQISPVLLSELNRDGMKGKIV